MQPLYRWREFDTLARGDRPHGDRARAAPDSLARTVSTLLRPSSAAVGAADVRARRVQRQRAQVDAGHARPRHAAGHLSGVSAFHHARGLGRRPDLAAPPRGAARAPRRVDHRWHQFSETGTPFGRRRASVLWCAGQDRQLSGRGDGRAVDRGAGVADRRAAVFAEGLDHRRRSPAVTQVPPGVIFQEKWRQALTLIRRARAAGLDVTAVLADAEFGDVTIFRRALHRWGLPYAVGVSRHLTVFPGTPAVHVPPTGRMGRPRSQLVLVHDVRPIAVRALALALPARAWRRVTWRNGTNRPWAARFAAVRVTPAHDWRDRRLAPEIWLLCEQDLGATPRTKYFFVNLPATASVKQLVRLAHQRWAIEQQYQELKTELGLDHFEGRSYPGWTHHVVLTAVAYAFLQRERMRRSVDPPLTFPAIRAIVQEIFTALLFAQQPDYYKRIQELQKIDLRI